MSANRRRRQSLRLSRPAQRPRGHRPLSVESLERRLPLAGLPRMLDDLNSNPNGPGWNAFVDYQGFTYFTANGAELWRTDGTASGTHLVYPIGTNADDYLSDLRVHNGLLVFARVDSGGTLADPEDDRVEIWQSNGTATGTQMTHDFGFGSRLGGYSAGAYFASVNDKLIASIFTPTVGTELWKIDFDNSLATLLKDLRPGLEGSNPSQPVEHDGKLYFAADDGTRGVELWQSDGTSAGTVLLKDINANNDLAGSLAARSSYPRSFMTKAGKVYFATQVDGGDGIPINSDDHAQLWSTDGTTAGTALVKDFGPGSETSYWHDVNGTFFGNVLTPALGDELWKSNGTAAGTVLVKDIYPNDNPDPFYKGSNPRQFTAANGLLYFVANDGVHGRELWKSDGTLVGTALVQDINPSPDPLTSDSIPGNLTNVNGTLYFTADDGSIGFELWKSDGTSTGTELVSDPYPTSSSNPWNLAFIRNQLFFEADHPTYGREPWTLQIGPQPPGSPAILDDLFPGEEGSYPSDYLAFDGLTYFLANDTQLWNTDGTKAGTGLIYDAADGTNFYLANLHLHNGILVFAKIHRGSDPWLPDADDRIEVWKSDGTPTGTQLVYDFGPGASTNLSEGAYFVSVNDTLFTTLLTPSFGAELWKVELNASTAALVKDIHPGEYSSDPQNLFVHAGSLFFSANDDLTGWELWKSDGTSTGTHLVKDLNTATIPGTPPTPGSSYPSDFVTWGDRFYFTVQTEGPDGIRYTPDDRGQLWQSDGSSAGTLLVKDFGPETRVRELTRFNELLLASVLTPELGAELWKSDGTEAGTVLLKDIRSNEATEPYGRGSMPYSFTEVNGILFFVADDGVHGTELWKTDGTQAGTVMVKDIRPETDMENLGSAPFYLTNVNGTLYFTAYNDSVRSELWKSNGTANGTVLVSDLDPIGSSGPWSLTVIENHLYFNATDVVYGTEPWVIRINQEIDFGDAPASYGTLAANNGARHELLGGVMLGTTADSEPDGQPSFRADADDLNRPPGFDFYPSVPMEPSDEDGLWPTPRFTVGQNTTISLWVSAAAQLDLWLDWNRNGVFDHPAEHLGGGTSLAVQPYENQVQVSVPAQAAVGTTYLRLRVSTAGGLSPVGLAYDGEVEDHLVAIRPANSTSDWQNPAERLDVNGDGAITPRDALLIIGALNSPGPRALGSSPGVPLFWYDTTGDGNLTPRDALLVINRLNQLLGEAEAPAMFSLSSDPQLAKPLDATTLGQDFALFQASSAEDPLHWACGKRLHQATIRRSRFS